MTKKTLLLLATTVTVLTMGAGCNQLQKDQIQTTTTTPVVVQQPKKTQGTSLVVAEKTVVGPRDTMKITQLCDGTVIENGTTKYCLGKNTLMYSDSSRTKTIASETIIEGYQEPPILLGVYVVSSVTDRSRIFISYKTDTCLTSNKGCPEIAVPSDNFVHYNIVFNIGNMTFRQIANYPANGTAVWNAPGTHALFIKDTCSEGGCNKSGIIGYDLDRDIEKSVTTEQAVGGDYPVAETKMFGAHWKSVMWKSDTQFSATLVNPDSTEKMVNGTF